MMIKAYFYKKVTKNPGGPGFGKQYGSLHSP